MIFQWEVLKTFTGCDALTLFICISFPSHLDLSCVAHPYVPIQPNMTAGFEDFQKVYTCKFNQVVSPASSMADM